jgi:RNA polymerase sigma-70 factor (ECF subfamily)
VIEQVLAREGPALARVAALYERDPARCEDLFQDICLAIWQALPRFRGDSSVRTFVFRIAHNRGLSHCAKRARCGVAVELEAAPLLADPRPGPEREAARSEERGRLRAAVLALPLARRQVLALALEGLSSKEIAEVLGITENNAMVRLSRARQALRRELERS